VRVLITGIGGSIGCHVLAHILHNTTWSIIGIDSFRHKGLTDRVEVAIQGHPEWRSRVKIFTHDLCAPISSILSDKIGYIDSIVHLASLSDVQASIDDPGPFILNNVQITTNILDYARALPRRWLLSFVHFSTDEVYGPSGESEGHPEWSTILPSNPYAASKAAQEAIAIAYWRSYGVPLIITNTMNNFGEMQQSSKFPAMIQNKVTAGETVTIHGNKNSIGSRHYIHSRNTADALIFILKNVEPYAHQDGEIDRPTRLNIVGDERVNNLELAKLIAKLLDKALKYELVDFHAARPGHDRHYGLDGTKLAKLGWKSPVSFEDSLKKTLEWSKENPEWLK
jgi:dTDP-glucose 4,6-dehydratase